MKALVSIVALSVAVNAGLVVAFVKQPTLAPPSLRSFFEFGSGEAAPAKAATKTAPAKSEAERTADFWLRLQSADMPTLVAQLRAAGFPPAFIRALAEAELLRRFAPRMDEIRRALAATPYWRTDSNYFNNSKIYEQINQFYRDRSKALRELLGQDAMAYAGMDPTEAQRRAYGNLAPAKIALVQQVADDYNEMLGQVRSATQGIVLPEDREKIAYLEKAKREDLAKILTPEELADYEMRTSTVTNRLRNMFTIMDASEAEFRTIYQTHLPYTETLYPTYSGGMSYTGMTQMDERRKATEAINATLKQTLGEARYAEYTRANDREFQQLYQVSRPDNLPYATLVQAYNSRQPAADASMKIANDTSMKHEDKIAALKKIAQDARTQILSTLGPTAGPAYADTARWITALEQGRAFSITPDGAISQRSVNPPRQVPAPKKQ